MNSQDTPSFKIGNTPIYGDAFLAPMDGFTDSPFRLLARRMGSAMSYTEFVNTLEVLFGHPFLKNRLVFCDEERPLTIQIFDENPERMLAAAQRLSTLRPDFFDINMGCSSKAVSGRGAGAGLMRTPQKIAAIFKTLSQTLDIPITGKIRLGWDDDSRNAVEIAHIVEDNGGKLLAVHGRTRVQGYGGNADWDAIAEVKRAVSIPVIGSGDVRTPADIERMRAHTGCEAVMIGRGAIGNPWIFSRRERLSVPTAEVFSTMRGHLEGMLTLYGPKGLVLFRAHANQYLNPYGLRREQRRDLLSCTEVDVFLDLLKKFLDEIVTI